MEFVKPLDPYTLQEVDEEYRDRSAGVKGHAVKARAVSDPMKEITHVIDYFLGDGSEGSAQDGEDLQQLRKAILAAIAAALGDGGDVETSLLAILKNATIFPEVETADKRMNISASSGNVVVDAGQTFLWRGFFRFDTDDFASGARTFATVADKTYHLRWHAPGTGIATPEATYPDGRFELADMTALSEADSQYDTTYDRMLIARVVTDGANAATVTELANARLMQIHDLQGALGYDPHPTSYTVDYAFYKFPSGDLNWARTPKSFSPAGWIRAETVPSAYLQGGVNVIEEVAYDRYGWSFRIYTDWNNNGVNSSSVAWQSIVNASA